MKKWIVPLVIVLFELIVITVFVAPNLSKELPNFLYNFLAWIEKQLTSLSVFLKLPVINIDGDINATISNIFIIVFINAVIFSLYFIISEVKHKKKKNSEERKIDLPKSEFDPILFERRLPKRRLAFIWVPLNVWILEFIILNSKDFQDRLYKNARFLYRLMDGMIDFYDANIVPEFNDDIFMRSLIFISGLAVFVFIYWSVLSILSIALSKPLAKMKAEKALKDHEKRLSLCQKEENIVENLEIIEHAKFKHDKSIVETIAKISPKNDLKHIRSKSTYFDHISHGITDLGVVERETKPIEKPRIERKPIKIIYPINSFETDNIVTQVNKDEESKLPLIEEDTHVEKIELAPKMNVFRNSKKSKTETDEKPETEKVKVKPLQPVKLRTPVNVEPVAPIKKALKEQDSKQPILEID